SSSSSELMPAQPTHDLERTAVADNEFRLPIRHGVAPAPPFQSHEQVEVRVRVTDSARAGVHDVEPAAEVEIARPCRRVELHVPVQRPDTPAALEVVVEGGIEREPRRNRVCELRAEQ